MFDPRPGDSLTIEDVVYRVAAHPAAPGMVYGQEGRMATVYQLVAGGDRRALKVFKPRYQVPGLAGLAARLAPFAELPGLRVCRRTVLTPYQHTALLRQHHDLLYAVLMPWVIGPTWMEVLDARRELNSEQSLALARSLTDSLTRMEQQTLAHGDLSAPNVLLPALADSAGQEGYAPIELVDVEQMYGPGLDRPDPLPGGSPGYAHRIGAAPAWGPTADRFSGAILLAEMLGWCDPRLRAAAWGESYFEPAELQQDGERARLLESILRERWGDPLAQLFTRAWASGAPAECPTFGAWLLTLPDAVPSAAPPAARAPLGPPPAAEPDTGARALVDLARRFEAQGRLEAARETYQEALTRAPASGVLAGELTQTLQRLDAVSLDTPTLATEPLPEVATVAASGRPASALAAPAKHRRRFSSWAGSLIYWLLWLALNAAAVGGAAALAPLVIGNWHPSGIWAIDSALWGAIAGLAIGIVHWLFLGRLNPQAGRWLLVSVVSGAGVGLIVSFLPTAWAWLAWSAWIGAVSAFMPWWGLRPQIPRAHWRVWVSIITWLGVGAFASVPVALAASAPAGALLFAGAVGGIIGAMVTARLLTRFLRNPALSVAARRMNRWQRGLIGVWVALVLFAAGSLLVWTGLVPCGWWDEITRQSGCIALVGKPTSGVWNAAYPFDSGGVIGLAPGGQTFASGYHSYYSSEWVQLWRVADGRALRSFFSGRYGRDVNSVAFAPDGQTLAAGYDDGTVDSWSVSSGSRLRHLSVSSDRVDSLAFAPDGQTLATTSDGLVRLWRVGDGIGLRTFITRTDSISSVAFSADGQTLATASGGTVRLWRVADGAGLRTLETDSDSVQNIAFLPDGQTLATVSDYVVRLWQVSDGTLFSNYDPVGGFYRAAFAPDGRTLATASYDGAVRLWRVR